MFGYKISKKELAGKLFVSPNWVTNGYWAVLKTQLSNRADFESAAIARAAFRMKENEVSEITDEKLKECFDYQKQTELVEFNRTPIILEGNQVKHLRMYRNHNAVKLVDESLVQLFDLDTVQSTTKPSDAMFANEGALVVMPCRSSSYSPMGGLRDEIVRVGRMLPRTDPACMPF